MRPRERKLFFRNKPNDADILENRTKKKNHRILETSCRVFKTFSASRSENMSSGANGARSARPLRFSAAENGHTHTHITYSYILRESLLAYEYMEKYTRRARAINTRFFTIAGAPGALIADAKSSGFLRQEAVRELLKPFPGLDLGSKVRGSPPCVAGVCSAHSLSAVFVVERFVPVERRLARA